MIEILAILVYLEMWEKVLPNLDNPSVIEQKGAEGGVLNTLKLDKK